MSPWDWRGASAGRFVVAMVVSIGLTVGVQVALAGVARAATPPAGQYGAKTSSAPAVPADAHPFVRQFASATPSTGAMFRWTWPNAAVDPNELRAQVDEVASAGYKGLEIASVMFGVSGDPFFGTRGYSVDPDEYGYGSPRWIAAVEATLEAAKKRGLQIDYTLGAQWPPAVPGLDVDRPGTTKELTYGYQLLDDGATFSGAVPQPKPRTYEYRTSTNGKITTEIKTAQPTLAGAGAVRCVADCSGKPVLDLGSNIDLTPHVSGGRLDWTPPDDGTWVVVGYWYRGTAIRNNQPSAASLAYLLQDPEARVIDYFSAAGADAFTHYFDTLLPPQTRQLLRRTGGAMFEDSIEISLGASRLWTPNFLDEFKARRGYSLIPYLPMLAADAPSGFGGPQPAFAFRGDDVKTTTRVMRDVDQTFNDLYIDYHVKPFRRWARSLGLDYRAQPYGAGDDVAEAATQVDVPECENLGCGTGDLWRLIASGGDMSGKTIISDELIPGATTPPGPDLPFGGGFDAPYKIDQRQMVREINKQYELGANQMVLFGLQYPRWPPSADGTIVDDYTGWPGFTSFGNKVPEAFGSRQPTWTMASDTSGYMARTQLVLQTGTRRTDVAVYNQGLGQVPAFDGGALAEAGYTYGYVTPGTLDQPMARVAGGRLAPSGPAYKALVIDQQESMPLANAQQIIGFAARGLPVIVAGEPPSRIPGYAGTAAATASRDAKIQELMAQLLARPNVHRVAGAADVANALASIDIAPAANSTAGSIRSVHRVEGSTEYYYLYNDSDKPASATVSLSGPSGGMPYSLDAWTGVVEPLAEYTLRGGRFETDLELGARESAVIAIAPRGWLGSDAPEARLHATETSADRVVRTQRGLAARAGGAGNYETTLSDGSHVRTTAPQLPDPMKLATWDLSVDDWQPAKPGQHSDETNHVEWAFNDIALKPWSAIPQIADASGIGTYTTTVTLPNGWSRADGAYLDLGALGPGSFRVRVNGKSIGVADQLSGVVDLGSRLSPGKNEIEVKLATPLINRVRVFQPDYADQARQDYGLLGPVSLTPYADMPLSQKRV
jgi:alpha-L-rhamnosidase